MTERAAVLTGEHFLLGDFAIAEGALAAGVRFFGGYPITPSTEVAERMAERLPDVDGLYVQMEDEIASINRDRELAVQDAAKYEQQNNVRPEPAKA